MSDIVSKLSVYAITAPQDKQRVIDLNTYAVTKTTDKQRVAKLSEYALGETRDLYKTTKLTVYAIGTVTELTVECLIQWSIELEASTSILWNVQTSTDTITAETALLWDINDGFVHSNVALLWNVSESVEAFTQLLWDIGTVVEADTALLWNVAIIDGVEASLPLLWNVAASYATPDRVVLPDYPITETWNYSTSIFRSISGKEQRQSFRRFPIITMQYSALNIKSRDFQQTMQALEVDADTLFPVPLFQYYAYLNAPANSAALELFFDVTRTNVIAGQWLAVIENDDTTDTTTIALAQIDTVTATGATLVLPVGVDATTNFFVCPVRFCRINTNGGVNNDAVYSDVTYGFISADRAASFIRADNAVVLDTVDDIVLLNKRYNANGSTRETYLSGVEVLDNERAAPVLFVDEGTRRQQALTYVINRERQPDLMDYWRRFAETTLGQAHVFAVPTYRPDAFPLAPPALGSGTVDLLGRAFYDVFTRGGYCGLMYSTPNGTEYRKVTGVAIVGGNNTRCTLSEPVGSSAGDNDFETVSFLMLMRLSSDVLTLTHDDVKTVLSFNVQMTQS